MKPCNLKFALLLSPGAMAVVFFSLLSSATAGLTRGVVCQDGGIAVVRYSWDSLPDALSSAILVRETIPEGAQIAVAQESEVLPAAVRREGGKWSFLVSREDALRPGSVSVSVKSGSDCVLSGEWLGLTAAGTLIGGTISGDGSIFASGSGGDDPASKSSFANFRIEGFSLERDGDSSKAVISWSGSGDSDVEIQWCAVLPGTGAAGAEDAHAAPLKSEKAAQALKVGAKAASSSGWKTVATASPGATRKAVIRRVAAAPAETAVKAAPPVSAEEESWLYSYALEASEPSGFFRLVIKTGDGEEVAEGEE